MAGYNHRIFANLKLCNWNADGIMRQRSIIIAFLQRHNLDVMCITETHLLLTQNFKIPGYNIIRQDRQDNAGFGGVAIVIKKSLKASLSLSSLIFRSEES